MKRSKWFVLVIAAVVVIAAATAGVLLFISGRARQADLCYLQQTEYTSVSFSMVPYRDMASDAIGEDFFSYYFGMKAATVPNSFRNANDLNDYLETALNSGNAVSLVYLELIPFQPGSFGGLADLIAAHPDTIFHILLDAPSMNYWTSQSTGRAKKQIASYQELAGELVVHSNVELYFAGAEDWLILNSENYTAPLVINRDLARHLALLTWANDLYRLTADNYAAIFTELENKIGLAATAQASADLSEWCLIFFGDSIIGNYTGSTSIPRVVSVFSGCEAYNLGIGGTSAFVGESSLYSFPLIVESFYRKDAVTLQEGVIYPQEMAAYYEKEHDGKQLCFVVNYGLNDYFSGAPIENPEDPLDLSTYTGALRTGIRKLQTVCPDSVIILAAPNYIESYSQGRDKMSDVGGSLTDYVEAAGRVAREEKVIFMNNYYDLGIDGSNDEIYLEDERHLSDSGRFLYAQALIRLIQLNCTAAE